MGGSSNQIAKGGTIRIPRAKSQATVDLSEYNFAKFAATYFTGHASPHYSKRPLKSSLLGSPLPLDEMSAQAIWITILRFMGDMAEAKYDQDHDNDPDGSSAPAGKAPIMQRLTKSLSRSVTQSKEFQEALASMVETDHQRLIRKTLKRKTKLPDILRKELENSKEIEYYHQWLGARSSNLEKLHFIIGHGILRPGLRDEILCQICKQLSNNPYHTSFAKGWVLLSLCIGCFSPSDKFKQYLRCFIRQGPELYAPYCETRLDRTLENGIRTQPPSWLELQATRSKCPISLNVILMDGSIRKLEVDSASTAKEAVLQLAITIGLKNFFGFSIFITLFDKVLSLGGDKEHIMDAISNCEQYAKEQGANDKKAPWKLYLRMEIFIPWFDPAEDEIATDLIYRQIVQGINFGEYRCKSDKDIAIIAVLRYYAENGADMDRKLLRQQLPNYLPKDLLLAGETALDKWESLIVKTFEQNSYVKNQVERKCAKEDITIFAQINWPMMFSRFFEAMRTEGPKLLSDNVIIAVNWTGLFLVDETEQVLAEFSYPEILSIEYHELEDSDVSELFITTIQKEDFTFKSFDSQEIASLVNFILNNLKARSTFVVAVKDYHPEQASNDFLRLSTGDLITLEAGTTGSFILSSRNTWSRGECQGKIGSFPTEAVYVLPNLTKPSETILKMFKQGAAQPKKYKSVDYNTLQRQRMHNLRKFAGEHFRINAEAARPSQAMHVARNRPDELWRHTRNPIKAPLLQKLQKDKNRCDLAITIFNNILKYMGDMPRGRLSIDTNLIFGPALKDEDLCDELYCQMMRQLTENRMQISEERGWDLMWLAAGVCYPTGLVLREVMDFLRTRNHNQVAAVSLKRIKTTIKNGQRKHPPHIIEVEAIQNRAMQIYHKIYFPDDTVEAFEIESSTRASDLSTLIAKRLDLKSREGLSLFVKIPDKAFSIPEDEYLFDFINELVIWLKETMPTRQADQQINCQYQLFFMRKLWINTTIAKDQNADLIFHFPQEIPKYLNGYYKVSKDNVLKLAALLYRIQFNDRPVPIQNFQELLPRLFPQDMINLHKPADWRKQLMYSLENFKSDDVTSKMEFLQCISGFLTFGSTFFVVQQTNDGNLPETILIAINKNGFSIVDPVTKDLLINYEFSQLNFWSSGNTYFHIRFGNMIGASKLLCTTTQGYKIDDLITTYIKYLKSVE